MLPVQLSTVCIELNTVGAQINQINLKLKSCIEAIFLKEYIQINLYMDFPKIFLYMFTKYSSFLNIYVYYQILKRRL